MKMKKGLILLTLLLVPLVCANTAWTATADIVFVVDESGSMSGEHSWISSMVTDLEAALVAAGVTGNTYSLIGYGDSYVDPNLYLNAGSAIDFTSATSNLVTSGGTEDGYDGIEYAFSNLTIRADAAVNVILITDEDRDIWDSSNTYSSILSLFGENAILNAVVDAYFNTYYSNILGVDSEGNTYTADGSGGYTSSTGGTVSSASGSTETDYIDLAWATEGAAWNLNLLRAGGDTATSFTDAFIDIKVQEIKEITEVIGGGGAVPEPTTALLFGIGILGLAGIGRKKYRA